MQRYTFGRTAILAAIAVFYGISICHAHVGDPFAERELSAAYSGPRLATGAAGATEAVQNLVNLCAGVHNEQGLWLLPPNTVVDAVRWDGRVADVYITLPEAFAPPTADEAKWILSPVDIETISSALARPFAWDSDFGGMRIHMRSGQAGEYGNLARYLLPEARQAPPADDGHRVDDTPEVVSATPANGGARFGGPSTNAARQPSGALSGVTVFASCGHGWTAGDSEWFLQRPVDLDMCEDYGNIDMLNYFVAYAFNAGATVVPFRPVGHQPLEIVLDNDDPGVTFTGSWNNSTSTKYYENGVTNSGIPYRWTNASTTETATARYTPTIPQTDFYPVFCFTVASTNRTLQTYRIHHSGGVSEVTIDHRNVGNGWIWLGNYYLEAGGDNYVEITNASPESGVIVADAIRWGGGFGDIVRPGPGSTSGYPRDEEAQRYWAQSELGNNAAGFSSSIWDLSGYSDQSDNVGTGGRWAAEMNQVPAGGVQVDRWKRVHIEFHTNASGGVARGQICLITDLGATTYQEQYATILSNEVDADMLALDSEFEHSWVDRSSPTYTSSYGAIATTANDNEFDATIIELAFHDNQEDAELLRDDRVRAAMAKATVQGIIRFLNTLPNSQVPLNFPPDTPRYVRVEDLGGGDVRVSWQPPLADSAHGDPATGYVVYQSTNGYGFGSPIVLGDVLSTTISGIPAGEIRYFRVAATNAGGESMPSEVLAVRRPASGTADVLVVNGYDRLRRQINPIQTFTQPPSYAGDSIERQIWRRSNSFDYIVQHAEALAANDIGFASCDNESVMNSYVQLDDYGIVDWILGTESAEDATLTSNEQNKLTTFLQNGGALFISGSNIGYDLIGLGNGTSFMQDTLRTGYAADDADTYTVTPASGGILAGLGSFDFDPANGAPYDVRSPDVLGTSTDAVVCLNYTGGNGGTAGVQYTGTTYNTVVFGFPFETITSPQMRADVMGQVIDFLATASGPLPFDYDRDGDVDMNDFNIFLWCFQGPDNDYATGHVCLEMDGDEDFDVDMADYALFQQAFTGAQ